MKKRPGILFDYYVYLVWIHCQQCTSTNFGINCVHSFCIDMLEFTIPMYDFSIVVSSFNSFITHLMVVGMLWIIVAANGDCNAAISSFAPSRPQCQVAPLFSSKSNLKCLKSWNPMLSSWIQAFLGNPLVFNLLKRKVYKRYQIAACILFVVCSQESLWSVIAWPIPFSI